jgi:hypothetical protein
MNDFAFVGILLAFFVLAALFVRACDRIIGPAEDVANQPEYPEPDAERPAA